MPLPESNEEEEQQLPGGMVFSPPMLEVVVALPNTTDLILIHWSMIMPLPRYGEGFHFMGGDYMIEHTCWSFSAQDHSAQPIYTIHLVSEEDFDDEDGMSPHRRDNDETGPDIKIGGV